MQTDALLIKIRSPNTVYWIIAVVKDCGITYLNLK